ncbi:MAG: dCTP deaminase domain-containing protein [Bacillota bacterium]|jgi:deoxycytidine triphosphate deaminase
MSVVDLRTRVTNDWNKFNHFLKSSDSLIYVEGTINLPENGPASLDLSLGPQWYDPKSQKYYSIEEKGVFIKPGEAVVLETAQRIGVPFNVFGIVTGKGKFIYKGVFVSTGKIDPGFNNKLLIGVFNGGRETINIRRDEDFCSCCFFQTESNIDIPLRIYPESSSKIFSNEPVSQKVKTWYLKNWKVLVPILISICSLVVATF